MLEPKCFIGASNLAMLEEPETLFVSVINSEPMSGEMFSPLYGVQDIHEFVLKTRELLLDVYQRLIDAGGCPVVDAEQWLQMVEASVQYMQTYMPPHPQTDSVVNGE